MKIFLESNNDSHNDNTAKSPRSSLRVFYLAALLTTLTQNTHSFSTTTTTIATSRSTLTTKTSLSSRNWGVVQEHQGQQQQQQQQETTQLWATVSSKGFDSSKKKKSSSNNVVAESSDDKKRKKTIDALEQWAKSVGILRKDIKVEAGPKIIGGGLGLLTTNALPQPNALLLQIPTDLTFSVGTSDLEPNPTTEQYFINRAKTYRSSPWYTKLSLDLYICDQICSVRSDGEDAVEMRPWLDSLPRKFDTPIHWSKIQREQLQYTPLQSMVIAQEKSYKKLYDNLKADIVPKSKLDSSNWTYQDFLWGCDVAKSRAFSGAYGGSAFDPKPYVLTLLLVIGYVASGIGSIEQASNGAALVFCGSILKDFVAPKLFKNKKYVICPMIDMANHVGINEEGNVAFEYFGNGYSLSTTKEMERAKEVRISYGPRSNDILLQQYGFVESDNVHDVYVMPPLREWDIQALEDACGRKFQPGRLEKLDRAGLLGGTSLSVDDGDETEIYQEGSANRGRGVVITRATGIDPAIMTALRVLVSSDEEWNAAGEAVGNFVTENSGGKENERLARLVAQKALELELEGKETTLDDDQKLLNNMYDDSTQWSNADILAVQFRIEKKKLLEETIFSFSLL